ncbi:7,8-dihydro-8-oxoguanine-triphosphatase [Arsukibacterium sp. MJ3]|uniref:8-oxo-dGTP diphosphatase MutT n=1 Tax=Arsukibacterium sp. MJ3 TaxID=1632859 RepID=UPI00062723CA|nr:8-oxo-dGTP diphosphatase MutT [Arsukibacterium sp. MJ3]KKO49059.1 7,8-dihydro-8-oxoguanine-triphosphatase [Arsukibacterium sp. MJ3]
MASLAKPSSSKLLNPRPQLHVAVGVILRQQHVLLALRSASQHQGGKWEFPGGKVEQAETVAAALSRELKEELAITVTAAEPFMLLTHSYPEREVTLDIWLVTAFTGSPEGLEGQPLQWVNIADLPTITLPEANLPIVQKLQKLQKLQQLL